MTYNEALQIISGMAHRGWRPGLDRMFEFLDRLGLAEHLGGSGKPKYLHVAGTNGKGSVTATLHHVLSAHGENAGAYFSPYVFDFRERIQSQLTLIGKEDLVRLVERVLPVAEGFAASEFEEISEFEFKTALGFAYWVEQGCDWVALEVGLGGRLDATNVVTPAASGIVSIGYDHVAILGETLAEIAAEKAGVAKSGRPLVLGDLSEEAIASAVQVAAAAGAPVWRFGLDYRLEASSDGWTVTTPVGARRCLVPGLRGVAQPHNVAVAVAMLDAAGFEISDEALRFGVAATKLPGRFQCVEVGDRTVVLDGAHNRESAAMLAESLENEYPLRPRTVLVMGMVKGHDPARFIEPLEGLFDAAALAPIDFHRAWGVDELRAAAGLPHDSYVAGSDRSALDWALDEAGAGGVVLVTGSFYLVGAIGRLLGLSESSGT